MRGEIEDDINVRLVKPEIKSFTIKIEKLPQLTRAHNFPEFVNRGVVLEGVTWHEHDTGRVGRVDKMPGGLRRGRHGLFDKYMLTSLDSLQSQRCVACWRRRDDNRVDVRQRILDAGIRGNAVVNLLTSVTDFGKPLVHARNRRDPGRGPQDAHMPRAPITDPNHCHSDSIRFFPHYAPPPH